MPFHDRAHAAFLLADRLKKYKGTNSIVVAVPRGGVPVGHHVASLLQLPLDIILCKKIGHPANEEYAIGSVSLDSVFLEEMDESISKEYVRKETERIRKDLLKRLRTFKSNANLTPLTGKNVILVDDGIATGWTLMACIHDIRNQKAAKIIVASPVASTHAAALLTPLADEFCCLTVSANFESVGQFYEDFSQVTDEEVKKILIKSP